MKLNKLFIVAFGLLIMLIAVVVWMAPVPSQTTPSVQNSIDQATEYSNSTELTDKERALKESRNSPSDIKKILLAQVESFQKSPGNINTFFSEFKSTCSNKVDCLLLLEQVLNEYPDQDFAQKFRNIVKRFPVYEETIQSTVMSTDLDALTRYNEIWKLREKMLGTAEAVLAFGIEKNYADYQFNYAKLIENIENDSTSQRLSKFKALREKYHLDDATDPYASYEHALNLALIGVKDPNQKQNITQQIRQQYFKADEINQMQNRDLEVQNQNRQLDLYKANLQQLENEMQASKGRISEQEWQQQYQQRVEQLRLNSF